MNRAFVISVSFLFLSYTISCHIIFLFIAGNWPELMAIWSEMEQRFLVHPYRTIKFKFKIRITAAVIIVAGFATRAIFIATIVHTQATVAAMANQTIESPMKAFISAHFPYVFIYVPYSVPLGLFLEFSFVPLFFAWMYMELFVTIVSMGIVVRFKQINQRLDGVRGKVREN
jgi:gustatory receptor